MSSRSWRSTPGCAMPNAVESQAPNYRFVQKEVRLEKLISAVDEVNYEFLII